MKEITGNLWDQDADIICITTNGSVKKDGSAVMGRGCALEAKNRLPGLDKRLGTLLAEWGNHVGLLAHLGDKRLYSFPVKHHWKEKANLELVKNSATEIRKMADLSQATRVVIPRPGCGNGGLQWSQVKLLISEILSDERFMIISDN